MVGYLRAGRENRDEPCEKVNPQKDAQPVVFSPTTNSYTQTLLEDTSKSWYFNAVIKNPITSIFRGREVFARIKDTEKS